MKIGIVLSMKRKQKKGPDLHVCFYICKSQFSHDVAVLSDLQSGFMGMVEIKSYNYKKLSLAYGGNFTSLVCQLHPFLIRFYHFLSISDRVPTGTRKHGKWLKTIPWNLKNNEISWKNHGILI